MNMISVVERNNRDVWDLLCTSLIGTNCTMSLVATRPVELDNRCPLSASRICQIQHSHGQSEFQLLKFQHMQHKEKEMTRKKKQKHTSICLKSAVPTPTIRIERGRSDALTKASVVSWRSVRIPSYKRWHLCYLNKRDLT